MKAHVQIKKLLRLRDESLFKENQAKGSLVEKSHVFFFRIFMCTMEIMLFKTMLKNFLENSNRILFKTTENRFSIGKIYLPFLF